LFDWLKLEELSETDLRTLIFRLVLSAICGQIIAWISLLKTDRAKDPSIGMTYVLMCILIAMATQIIGSNVARAFSLVGALSIVRFRTAITSTQDVAFVLASVVVGMAIGAGQYWVGVFGLITLAAVSWLLKYFYHQNGKPHKMPWHLSIRATASSSMEWQSTLDVWFESIELIAAQTAKKGSSVEYEYRATPRSTSSASEVLASLSALTQLESVAIRCH
jgi:uncharacterized membrane protein YhiD involved in acid resistance